MKNRSLFKNKDKRKRLVHILAGVMILVHAFEKYASGHGNPLFFAVSGSVFLSIAIFHHSLEKKFPWIDGVFFFIEALLSITVALDFFHEGKKGLPWTYLLLSFFQFFMAFFKSSRAVKQHQTHKQAEVQLLAENDSIENFENPVPEKTDP